MQRDERRRYSRGDRTARHSSLVRSSGYDILLEAGVELKRLPRKGMEGIDRIVVLWRYDLGKVSLTARTRAK